jgi:hypothetical protein
MGGVVIVSPGSPGRAAARWAAASCVALCMFLTSCTSPGQEIASTSATPVASSTKGTPAPGGTMAPPRPSQRLVFGDPWSKNASRVHAVSRSALKLITGAKKGQSLTFAMFNLTYPSLAESLVKAYRRGVRVRVLANGEGDGGKQTRLLRRVLGTALSAKSYFRVRAGDMRLHSKFLLVSARDAKGPVVWTASGNVTMAGGRDQANEAMVTTGDAPLYEFLVQQFDLMSRGVTDPEKLARVATTTTAVIQTFPLPEGGAAHDPVLALLKNVTCTHGEDHTVIRLAHYLFSERLYLAAQLRELKTEGCDIRMIGYVAGWDIPNVEALIKAGPGRIDLRNVVGTDLHTKINTIEGWDAAGSTLKVAMVGTHNLTGRALTRIPVGVNDEFSLTIKNPAIVDAYSAWVDMVLRKHSVPVK